MPGDTSSPSHYYSITASDNTPMTQQVSLVYAQSGGVTSVINQSAAGAIQYCRANGESLKVLAGLNGIEGIMREQLVDSAHLDLNLMRNSPGAFFGSCRRRLPNADETGHAETLERILAVFKAHKVRYFLYNGGNDSQDTLLKIAAYASQVDYPLHCIGIPKTIDNDLFGTDTCPGFGSAAKFLALTLLECGLDIKSNCHSGTRVLIVEVMGRNTGWLAAATGLVADRHPHLAPDVLWLPELPLEPSVVVAKCQDALASKGFCIVVAAEGINLAAAGLASAQESLPEDSFGHPQLGGVAPKLAHWLRQQLSCKTRWCVPDCIQRSARHMASDVDLHQAFSVGKHAAKLALGEGEPAMVAIKRTSNEPYQWQLGNVAIEQVANRERTVPRSFLDAQQMTLSEEGLRYFRPLIQGEAYPVFHRGLPDYQYCDSPQIEARLPPFIPPGA